MKASIKGFPKHFFRIIITVPAIGLYILSLLGWYVSPAYWPLPSLFSPGFVWAWFFLWVLLAWWVKKQKLVALVYIVLILAGLPPMLSSFSLGISRRFPVKKEAIALRVMQWNCMGLPGTDKFFPRSHPTRKAIANFINRYQPDIICLEDFADIRHHLINSNRDFLRDTLGYHWENLAPSATELRKYGFITYSTAIYSKRPLLNAGLVYYSGSPFPEAIVWVDVALEGKPVRVVATHFASMHFSSQTLFRHQRMPYMLKPDSAIIMNRNILAKMQYFQGRHVQQAQLLRRFLDTCAIPVVLAGDLNTVPANYLYRQVKGNLQDGFMGSTTGMGNTYNYLAPNLRIDYLFNDKRLKPSAFHHFEDGFVDHDHLLADYQWRNP